MYVIYCYSLNNSVIYQKKKKQKLKCELNNSYIGIEKA